MRQLAIKVNAGESYSGKYFKMTKDIDLGGISEDGQTITAENEFTAIGTTDNKFSGTFDGGGYEVSGLYINQLSSDNQGLFGNISYATIKNLGVSGSVTGYSCVGGIVGRVRSDSNNIINCYNKATIEATYDSGGGVVGYVSYCHITNCYNLGSVKSALKVGGVTSHLSWYSSVTNCYNAGSVSTTDQSTSNIGGVVGYVSRSTVTNSYWDSTVYIGDGIGEISIESNTYVEGKSTTDMQAANFVTLLNNGAYTYNQTTPTTNACGWKAVLSSYPTLNFGTTPSYSQIDGDNPGIGL